MERRHGPHGHGGARLRKNVACDVLLEGRDYKGVATELAPHEIHVQLAGKVPPEPSGAALIRLRAGVDDAAIELRAVVTYAHPVEAGLPGHDSAIEARIIEAAPEYHALFEQPAVDDDGPRPVEILVEIDADLPAVRSPDEDCPVPVGQGVSDAAAGDPDWPVRAGGAEQAGGGEQVDPEGDLPVSRPVSGPVSRPVHREGYAAVPSDGAASGAATEPPAAADEDATEPADPAREAAAAPATADAPGTPGTDLVSAADGPFDGQVRLARTARAANAIVVYDGSKLQDVYDALERLGARPERARLTGPTRFRGWDLPPKLLVVDAQDALALDWPRNPIDDGVVRIAVASSASAVVGKILRGRGFHYLVRRPVHPQALEVLLRHALHRGYDRRKAARAPMGVDARLSTGRWRWPAACTLLELSAMGCRVVTREDVPLLNPVRLRISRAVSGSRTITLRARVVRRRRDAASGEWALALRFVAVPPEQRGRLDDLLARAAVGPSARLVDAPSSRLARWWRTRRAAGRAGASAEAASLEAAAQHGAEAPPVPLERRRARRTTLRGEVVALDAHRERVSAVLTGRDLSTLGMRVEPHPELVVGRRLVVAFYDCVSRGTVEMLGEVVRDGGAHGLGIRFVEMDAGTAARLEQLVATLPQVESLVPHTRPLVVARIRADEDAGEDAAARGGASGHQARDAGATEVEGARVEATEDEATGQEASVDEASGIDTPEIEATREGAEADPDLEQCAAPDTEAAHCAGEASGHGEASEHGQGRGSKRRRGRKRSRRRRGR